MQMRIAYIARQRRALTKALVGEAVERYFQALADEIASGEWVDLPGIGKIQVIQEAANGVLTSFGKDSQRRHASRHVPDSLLLCRLCGKTRDFGNNRRVFIGPDCDRVHGHNRQTDDSTVVCNLAR